MARTCWRIWRIRLPVIHVLVIGILLFIGTQTAVMKSFFGYLGFAGQYSEFHKNISTYQPSHEKPSQLWQNVTKGVMDCQTGKVISSIDRPGGQQLFAVNLLNSSWKSETDKNRKQSFSRIFKTKLWRGQQKPVNESDKIIGSGPGSTLNNSVEVRKTLAIVISQVKSFLGKSKIRMLDIPCGDLTWMSEFMKARKDVEYYGMDIVPDIIEHHKRVYTPKYPHMTFINQDIVAEPLDTEFDLIHTRQMTQHLTAADTLTIFKHFKDSGSHFLMATTVPNYKNVDLDNLKGGRFRLQDLNAAPYFLPLPICQSYDVYRDYNAIWKMN